MLYVLLMTLRGPDLSRSRWNTIYLTKQNNNNTDNDPSLHVVLSRTDGALTALSEQTENEQNK